MNEAVFDGVNLPRVTVLIGVSGSLDPGAAYIHLGVGPGLGTGMVAGTEWTDISADVTAIARQYGSSSDLQSASPGSLTVTVDAFGPSLLTIDTDGTALLDGTIVEVGTPIQFRAEHPLGTIHARFAGEIADIDLDLGFNPTVTFTAADGLEKLGRAFLATITPGLDGDTTGERVGHLLDAAAWPTTFRSINTGYTTLGRTTHGDHALPLLQAVEKTEYGQLWVEGQTVMFYDRHRTTTATRSTTVQASFTDSGGGGDVEMTGVGIGRSRETVFTEVHITRDPAPPEPNPRPGEWTDVSADEPEEQVAIDETAPDGLVGLSFPDQVGKLLRNDSEALALAEYLVDRSRTPDNRVRDLEVDATTQGLWSTLLGLRLQDRVEIVRDTGPVTVTIERLIQSVAEQITNQPSWTMSFGTTVAPPAPDLWIVGSSQVGVDTLGW